ncbi:MAG: FHA domain-containing protein, partial [Dehalococcoidia bacterium]
MSRERGSSERRSGSQFFQSILRPGTVAGALLLSVIVGTVLTFVYQGGQILAGHLTALMLTRLLLNYLVPYTAYSVFAAVLFHQRESAEDRPFVVMRSRPVGPAPELNVGPRDADAPSRQEAFQGGLSLDQPEASAWPPPANGALPLSHSRGGSRADEGLSPMPSIAELRVISGPSRGERYAIGAGGLIIGREEDSDVILDDPLVSRHHVRVRRQQEAYVVEDLGSRNGTLFNGDRLLRATPLLPGDRLTVGASEFQFNLRPPGISPALPEQRVQLSPRGTDEVMLVGPAPIVHE